jgi:RNA polymerase sigma-70 factor (ECF subfamily)
VAVAFPAAVTPGPRDWTVDRVARLNAVVSEIPLQCDRVIVNAVENEESRVHRALVDRAKQGDREAFDALAREVGDRCLAIAHRILRDADLAEDAVQTALIVAWREVRTLRDAERFEPWLHRILTNECYAEARRSRRWSADLRILHIDIQPETAGILTVNDRDQLERGFRRLTLEQRAVLVFHHYLGLSQAEVAVHLDIPVGTVKSRLHHATTALRASLEADARTPYSSQDRLA